MKQVIVVKLEPSAEQAASLIETMQAFNRGCDYVAAVAFEKRQANKIALQPFVYSSMLSGCPAWTASQHARQVAPHRTSNNPATNESRNQRIVIIGNAPMRTGVGVRV